MPPSRSFWQELKNRRVIRVGIVYLAVAWALIEGSETLSSILELPAFVPRLVFAVVVLGLPVVLFLAWAFQVTPEGIERAEPVATDQRSVPFLAGIAVGIVTVAGLAFVYFGVGDGVAGADPADLDRRAVAVMPFRVNAPGELEYLGGGFMDLIAARLDGEVGPRAIDPGAVAGAASLGVEGSDAVARHLGAGLVLTGSVVGNPERIVANAELVESSTGALRAGASAEGPADSLSAIADRLVVQLLGLSEGEYTTSIASLTTTSPDALKEYLLGKQAFRDGNYYEGIEHLDEALAIDSTFALAAIARADGATNAAGVGTGGNLERAWRHRERLSPRDLDYLEARLGTGPRTEVEEIEALERLTREQPDRIEGWYWLFEAVFHQTGIVQGDEWETRVRALADRILQLDPGYYPAVDHLVFIEPEWGTPAQRQRTYTRFYERPGDDLFGGMFRELAAGGDRLVLDVDALASMDVNGITHAPWFSTSALDLVPDDFVAYVDAALEESRRRAGVDLTLGTVLNRAYGVNLSLGRPGRAEAVREEAVREGVRPRYDRAVIEEALWYGATSAAADADVAVERIDERLRGVDDAALTVDDVRDLTTAEIWRHVRAPDYSDPLPARRMRAILDRMAHPVDLQLEAYALLLEAWVAVRAGDPATSARLDRLLEIVAQGPGGGVTGPPFLFAVSAVHEELGDVEGALESLERISVTSGRTDRREDPRRRRGLARLSALVGDTARAVQEYRRYLTLMTDAEPSVLPEVEAVRAELARLGG